MKHLRKCFSRSKSKPSLSDTIEAIDQTAQHDEHKDITGAEAPRSLDDTLRLPPTVPPGQHQPPAPGPRLDSNAAALAPNPPRYSVSNTDSDLADRPPLLQRRTPLGLPPSRTLKQTWQDINEGGSFRNILPCRSFRGVALKKMPPSENLFIGFFNTTAIHYKHGLMQRTGLAVEEDGALRVNDKLIKDLDMKNRTVRVIIRRRRMQARKFIECIILDGRVDPDDGKCNVLYEIRWVST